ncbi:MAG: CDP-alcohol phosphatidyltransferase family protein [Eubacteriales bacterium]|nr:CDP-alcohol phosphatidyltransferase family protein [Eubacteriales bacterium]
MKKDVKKEYFSVPNLMGYFRILLVPVYLAVYLNAETTRDYYIAAGIMVLSFLTDLFDGKVARRFDMVTEFGKILDPVADKITQGTMALSFSFRFPAVRVLLGIFLIKEIFMGAAGAYMMRKGRRMDGAQMHGKICTAVLDVIMFLLLLIPDIPGGFVAVLVTVGVAVMLWSLAAYARMYLDMWKEIKKY